MTDPSKNWAYDIVLKNGFVMENMVFDFNFSKAMEQPGYFNGAIYHDHNRIWDIKRQKCVLYGEIVAWETKWIPLEDDYPNNAS